MSFLDMSLMGGTMILCILLLRFLFRGRLSAAILSAMWVAVFLRLMIPVAIPSSISFKALVSEAGQESVKFLSSRPASSPSSLSPLLCAWIGGSILCALFFLVMGYRQRRALREALPVSVTPELLAMIAAQRLSRKVCVYTSDRISTPLTFGMIKPRIILPSQISLSGEELGFVIAHECAHIAGCDAVKKHILLVVVCLHWFNPLVWFMAAVIRRDMELNCDRQVLKVYGPEARAAYARTLLGLQEQKRFSGVLLEYFSKSPLEERIRSIMMGRKTTLAGALTAIAVYCCVAAVFATSPGAESVFSSGMVWVSAKPFTAYDIRQFQASEASVYVWNGDVLMAGHSGIEYPASSVMFQDRAAAGSLSDNDLSVSIKYGNVLAISAVQGVTPAYPVPVLGMTYTIRDGVSQP